MKYKIIILLLLLGFGAKAQIATKILRFIPVDTVATPPTFPAYAPAGMYLNFATGQITFKDASGYHKLGSGTGGSGGGGGTIVGVNGTTNEIDAAGTTTRTLSLSPTFKSSVAYVGTSLSQFAATTSAELRGILSDEVGTGAFYTVGGALGTPASATGTNFTGIPLTTGLSTFTSSDLAGRLTNESGTGVVAYTISPTFTTPNLGTPSAIDLTNATGLSLTALGSFTSAQLRAQLTDEVGIGSFYTVGGALGTPASATGTNFTGIPITGLTSTTSTELGTLLTNETGTGQVAFSVSPSFTTPNLGVPSAVTLTNGTGLPLTGLSSGTSANLASVLTDEVGTGALYMGQPIEANTTVTGDHTLALSHISNYSYSGIIRYTGSAPIDVTVPTNASVAFPYGTTPTKIVLNNASSDTVRIYYASGVTGNDGGYNEIPPNTTAVLIKSLINTWDVRGTGPGGTGGGSSGDCYTVITSYTADHTLTADDITECNNNGFIRFTPTSDVTLTIPLDATLDVDDGTFIAISNQSVDDTVTVDFVSGITGGNHVYDEIYPGDVAVIVNVSTDVWDINGTKPAASSGGSGGSGDVVGPASATNNVPVLFDGTTGKLIKNSTPTGSGNPVLATSPTLVTPNLGTPSAVTLTNGTGLPASGITATFSSWTPTITGFSSNPTMECRYMVIGKAFFFWINSTAHGTSNATSYTITIPFTSSTITTQVGVMGQMTNNGSLQSTVGKWTIAANTNVINLCLNSSSTGGTAWTASGNKSAALSGMIEIQ